MDISADGMSYGGDFQKQSGPRHIVNIQGPFYQRGAADASSDQQKNVPTPAAGPIITNDHNEMQGSTTGRKAISRAAGGEGFKTMVDNPSLVRSEQIVVVPLHASQTAKHLVDEVEEEEDDDGEVDASVCVSSGEQTGRWTRKEHEVFLEALKKFGKVTT